MRRFYLLAFSISLFFISSTSYSQVAKTTQAGLIEAGFGLNPNLTGATGIAVKGNYAYVVGIGDVLQILDITLPGLPLSKGSLANGVGGAIIKRPQHIVVQGNYAYITNSAGSALEIVDVSNPAQPVHKSVVKDGGGNAPYMFNAWGLAVAGNYAYVTIDNGLEIIDISNPAAPLHKGVIFHNDGVNPPFLQQAVSIKVVGNLAYVGCLGALQIIDVSDPANPVARGMLLDQGNINGNPPFLISPYSISVQGNYAYVPDNNRHAIEIIDISNPDAPAHVSNLVNTVDGPFLSYAFGSTVSGNYMYVTSSNLAGSFEVIDISNPLAPVHKGGFAGNSLFNSAREIVAIGKYAYVPSRGSNAFTIVDVSDPSNPKVKGSVSNGSGGALINSPQSVFVKGKYAYLGNVGTSTVASGFEIIDISNPAAPLHTGSIPHSLGLTFSGKGINSVIVDGNTAFLANRNANAVVLVDVTNPTAPFEGKKIIDGTNFAKLERPTDIKLNAIGTLAVVTSSASNAIEVISVSDRSNPSHISSFSDGNGSAPYLKYPSSLDVQTTTGIISNAYVASEKSNALEIINLSNPSFPTHRGAILDGNGSAPYLKSPKSVTVKGNYAYVASYGSSALEIIDVTNPAAPVHKGAFKNSILDSVNYVAVAGNYAYLTCAQLTAAGLTENGRVVVVDVTNPANPTLYQVFRDGTNGAMLDYPTSITISGGYGYVTNPGLFEALNIIYLYGPGITGFSPASAPAGSTVTVNGQNFNTFITPSVNGVQGNVTEVTENTLSFTVPANATNGKINLNYAGQNFVTETNFIVIPTASSATALQQNGFTANWSDVGATKYYLDLSTDNFTTFVGDYNNYALGSTNSFTITNLNSATTYQYRVRSSDGTLVSANSNVVATTTKPATPTANESTLLNQTGFTANWNSVAGASNYFLDVATDADFSKFVLGYNNATITSSETSQVVTGLSSFSTYYYRVRAANSAGSSSSSNVVKVVTLDITAPVITDAIAPNATTLTVGATPVLNTNIADNVSVTTATLFYRPISSKAFKTAPLQGPGGLGGNYSITIQSDWYDELGLEYYFSAADESGNKTETTPKYIQLIKASITLPALPSGDGTSDYRIVSFPYPMPGGNGITSIYSNVQWSDNTKAGIWWWNPALKNGAGDYQQFGADATIDPGKGYWIITRTPVSPTLSNVPAPKYNQDNLYSMTLQPGWNEVGNPYPVAISWDEVVAFNLASNPGLVISAMTIYSKDGFATTKDALLPAYQGGFVKNSSSSPVTIQIPFPGQNGSGRQAGISSNISDDNWNIFLHISQNNHKNSIGGFGMNHEASAGVDRFDNFNPPGLFDHPEVNFTNQEEPAIRFSNDVVQSQNEYVWTVTPNGTIGQSTQLLWSAESSDDSKGLFLFDEENLNVIDMRSASQYDFVLTSRSRFKIYYGEDVEKKIITEKITATLPFPNPLNNSNKFTIKLSLPNNPSEVNMRVYNSQGILIGTLDKHLNVGIHPIEFTMPENSSPGIYIYRLAVANGKETSLHTGKIVKP